MPNLSDPIFQRYLLLVAATLTVSGGILAMLRWGFGQPLAGVWRTWRGWLVMAPLALGTVALGRLAVILGVALLSLAACREFCAATGLADRDRLLARGMCFGIVAVAMVCLVTDPRVGEPGWYGLFMALPAFVVGFLLMLPVLRDRVQGQLQAVALAILGFVYLGWMLGHLAFLANAKHAVGYLLFLLFAVEICDVAAFTTGRLFGRRKLRPAISPNKTVAGALGGLAVGLALPWLLRFSLPQLGPWQLVLTGITVGVGGQLGDLAISVIKRDLGVKDMGSTIPGHGGVLDRIDSLIFVAPLFFHQMRWFYDIY